MEIRQLRAFSVLAEELNFRKTAEILGMSQPPLTRLIGELESQLGVKLFHRTTRSVSLTGEGVLLFNRAKNILREIKEIEADLKKLSTKTRRSLVIYLHHSAIHSNFPKLLSSFSEQFPHIKVELMDFPAKDIQKKLISHVIDLAVGISPVKSPELKSFEVHSHELGLLISRENKLSRKESLRLQDLAGETLIFHGKDDHLGFQKDFHQFLKRKNIDVKVYYKKKGETCPGLAGVNKGILITSRAMISIQNEVKFVPFSDFFPKVKVVAQWSTENINADLQALTSFIEEQNFVPTSSMDYHLN